MNDIAVVTTAETSAEPVFRLIYRSRSTVDPAGKSAALGDILRKSRANNAANGVTGALLMYDDWFAQVLEGPEPAVRSLYERIRRDPRHDTVQIRDERTAPRAFARWAMADVGEHGDADMPVLATKTGITEGGAWKTPTADQADVLTKLRDLTRGYGRGY